MLSTRSLMLLATALCASLSSAAPAPQATAASSSAGTFWLGNIDHSQDTVWNPDDPGVPGSGYQIFRNVMDPAYGAKGDGSTDDTAAINKALSEGGRCGGGGGVCDSSTVTPAIVYFPPGTYIVSGPLDMYYYTQMIGDANDLPTLQATSGFTGMAIIDADPYDYADGGVNWYTNQNNFFRQVRNFVIDISRAGNGMTGAGIHWQVAQATSIQNVVFQQSDNPATAQQGIFMDNGSGGFMADLTFNNGHQCAFLGSQQFTSRNMTFNNCQTAIYMNWNWGWTIHGVTINGAGSGIGLDMSVNPTNQSVGSVVLADSTISGVDYGVRFSYKNDSSNFFPTGGTLILDNVDMSKVGQAAIVDYSNATILAPGMVDAWSSGNGYHASAHPTNTVIQGSKQENAINPPQKVQSLLNSDGDLFTQSRPQYENLGVGSFVSAKSNGCAGDGTTDDTAAIIALLQKVAGTNQVAYFEHGAYLVKDTITVPANVMMTGEIWPLIVADSQSFNDSSNPKPVFQVGKFGGESGFLQISDFIFETNGPATGAVMIQWNLQSTQSNPSGMWDTHVRIGGSAGTNLEGPAGLGGCRKNPNTTAIDYNCEGVFLMFHATPASSNVYLENVWFWVADHDLDHDQPKQISIYSARGALIESKGAVWLWGTASEHSLLYQYQIYGAEAVFGGFMQSETPYMQPNPEAPAPFSFNNAYDDPLFTICSNNTASSSSVPCKDAWGLRIWNSKGVTVYGTGFYSFFNNYAQECVGGNNRNCQQNMIHIQNSEVAMYTVNTANSVTMLIDDGMGTVTAADNRNWFCDTMSYYFTTQ